MLIVQPCSDNVHLMCADTEILVARDCVEYDLSGVFLRLVQGQDVLFVSGPGSFTNLRVSALVINMYLRLVNSQSMLYSIDKLALYGFFVSKGLLPRYGIVYIGQTKNFRLYDFAQREYHIVGSDFVPDYLCFVDQVSDRYFAHLADKKVNMRVQDDCLVISFGDVVEHFSFADIPMQSVSIATPDYMIEPVIG